MPQMSQNDSHIEVSSFEMSQNDSFSGLKCPTEHPLSVADETPATPPSQQNDTPDGDHNIPHTPTPQGRWPHGIFLVASSAFGGNQKTLHPRPGRLQSPSNCHPQRSEGSQLCWWDSPLCSECLATAATLQSYRTLTQVYHICINSPLPWEEGWAGGPFRTGNRRHIRQFQSGVNPLFDKGTSTPQPATRGRWYKCPTR